MIQGLYKIFDHWHQKGTVWICSDPHFDDPEMVNLVPNRPTAEEQVKLLNSKVGKRDTLIVLGDIGNVEWVKKVRGYKILIAGNHDAGLSNYERIHKVAQYSRIFYSTPEKAKAEFLLGGHYEDCEIIIRNNGDYWEIEADNHLFDEVYGGPLMIGEKLILSHEPVDVSWAFNIHGHDHSGWHSKDNHHLNVCLDRNGFLPLNLNQLMRNGLTSRVETIHRTTIDTATKRSKKRKGKKQ